MNEIASRITQSLAFGGRLFAFALLVAGTVVVALLVENERHDRDVAARADAVAKLGKLGPLAAAADQAADRLEEYLIARHGAYADLPTVLRGLQRDLRTARLSYQEHARRRRESDAIVTAEDSRIMARANALVTFNSGSRDARSQQEPSLERAELSHGSFQQADQISDLKLRNLSRYLWLISSNVKGMAQVDPNLPTVDAQIRQVHADATRTVGRDARQQAAILWEHMLQVAGSPDAFGLETDANGQVSTREIKQTFVSLRSQARLPGLRADEEEDETSERSRIVRLQAASVNAPGLGISLPLDLAIAVTPFVVSAVLLLVAALFSGAAALVRVRGHGESVKLPLPFLVPKELEGGQAMGLGLLQLMLVFAPLGLICFAAFNSGNRSILLLLPLLCTLVLWLAMRRLRRMLQDNPGPYAP